MNANAGQEAAHNLLLEALGRHQSGDFDRAGQSYRRALALSPSHPDGNRLYGTLCLQTARFAEAERHLRLALAADAGNAETQSNLAAVLIQTGRAGEAVPLLQSAIESRPGFTDALSNLGEALRLTGDRVGARNALIRALAAEPGHANALYVLGVLRAEERDFASARACFERALETAPLHFAARRELANLHILLGQYPEAELLCRKLLHDHPDEHEIRCALASILISARFLKEAEAEADRVLSAAPDHPRALVCKANVLRQSGRPGEAIALFARLAERGQELPRALGGIVDCQVALGEIDDALEIAGEAIRLFPEEGLLHLDRGVALEKSCRAEEACESYRAGLRRLPDHPALHFNLGTQLLLLGRYAEGWPEYEWRTRLAVWGTRAAGRFWRGEPTNGRPLVIRAEQGAGDTLQFVRLLKPLAARGERIVMECQAPLKRLLASAEGMALLREPAETDPEAWQVSLLSLPGILGLDEAGIPARVPYLAAAKDDVAAWGARLVADQGFRVGIAWSGNPQHMNDANRSCPLSAFFPLFGIAGVTFYSLQPGGGEALRAEPAARGVADPTGAIGDFADTAALMMNLDLVIAVDTSVAHLAGALARPVWTLLPFAPDWRWQLAREDTPWYPTMRLFRQARRGDWESVMRRVAAALGRALREPA